MADAVPVVEVTAIGDIVRYQNGARGTWTFPVTVKDQDGRTAQMWFRRDKRKDIIARRAKLSVGMPVRGVTYDGEYFKHLLMQSNLL